MKYIITYDLNKIGQNYEEIIKAIKNYRWAHPLESTWFVKTDKSAEAIYADLKRYIDENDRLFIAELGANRQGWLAKTDWDFLNSI